MTKEQCVRWLTLVADRRGDDQIYMLRETEYLALCAAIAAEAVAAERKRCADILSAARSGVIDGDLRCIRSWIESGEITS